MITAITDLKMAAGTEGCYRITITDASCPNPTVAGAAVNNATTTAADAANQGVTDSEGVVYSSPIEINTQGLSTEGTDASLEAYKMSFI